MFRLGQLRLLPGIVLLLLVLPVSLAQNLQPVPTNLPISTEAPAGTLTPALSTISKYPRYNDVYVNDFAGVLSTNTESEIRRMFTDLRTTPGVEAVVVTMNSFQDYGTNDTIFEEFATNLFNDWGIGDSDSDGILILVGIADRKVRVEVGVSYEDTFNTEAQTIIDEFMLPQFRQNDYDRGIYEGAKALVRKLTDAEPASTYVAPYQAASSSSSSSNSSTYTSPYTSSSSSASNGALPLVAGGGALAAVGGGAFAMYRRYARFRPRTCPSCGKPMRRLDEVEDDQFLDEGQRHEERLQSVDYDVWKCDSCNTHQVFGYNAMFSGYRSCVKCGYNTMATFSNVIDYADCYSSGLREVTQQCSHCNYRSTYQETIPRKDCSDHSSSSSSSSSHSSSSGGSFGGGKSSGSGASGSW